jgi:bacterial/archaeal transporter family-2 protein
VTKAVALPLAVLVGCLVGLQAPTNSRLGSVVGTFPAATISFLVGTIALAGLATVLGGWGQVGEVRHVPLTYLLGGFFGAAFVSSSLVTVRVLGAGGVTAATIAGQLAVSVVIDHFGLLGVAKQPASVLKLLGVALLAAGTYLVVRE